MVDRLSASTASAIGQFEITPDDDDRLPHTTRMIRVGTGGTLQLALAADPTVIITYTVVDGEQLPVQAVRVLADETTATDLIGWY